MLKTAPLPTGHVRVRYLMTCYDTKKLITTMTLKTVVDTNKSILNRMILLEASKKTPSLVIDCANAANPHNLYPEVSIHEMDQMYVVELELLYKFRDVLKEAPDMMRRLNAKFVAITTSESLFNYQNEKENFMVMLHSWELIKGLGKENDVLVGVRRGSVHHRLSMIFSDEVIEYGSYRSKPKNSH